MTKVLNYIWRGWLAVLGLFFTILYGIPILLLSIKRAHYRYAYFFIRLWCISMFYGMGFRYRLRKFTPKSIDQKTQYIFIANHTSMIDVMLPCILMPHHPLCYVGKKELEKIPIFGLIYKRIFVTVDRSSAKSRAEVYTKCAERIREGQSIVIFPEGGVPDDTSVILDKFKDGAFSLSSQHRIPIAVFTFKGLKEMFPFDNSKGHPGVVEVDFLDILEPTENFEDLKNDAHHKIKTNLVDYYSR